MVEIKSERELAAFLLGVTVGQDFDCGVESFSDDTMIFSDYESLSVFVSKGEPIHGEGECMKWHYAVTGAAVEAQKDAKLQWEKWTKHEAEKPTKKVKK